MCVCAFTCVRLCMVVHVSMRVCADLRAHASLFSRAFTCVRLCMVVHVCMRVCADLHAGVRVRVCLVVRREYAKR